MKFDEATSKRIERNYGGREMVERRRIVRDVLAPAAGERILDIGCGPGFYEAEIAPIVGQEGRIVGVDSSNDMLALAEARCAGLGNVDLRLGDASSPPVDDGEFDAIFTVQVMEYVSDTAEALAAMHRALKPAGRVLVWDVDWSTVSWHSSDQARMQRVLSAWDGHLVHPSLPRCLLPLMRNANFVDVIVQPFAFATHELSHETYGGQMVGNIQGFVPGHNGVTAEEADAWAAEQRALAARGEFFMSVTQFCVTGRRPS